MAVGAFPGTPPFPKTVPTAPLVRISLAKLLARDPQEEENLWDACCNLGFFYLDLRGAELAHGTNEHTNGSNGHTGAKTSGTKVDVDGDSLLNDADALFEVAKEFFDLPVEEKIKYDFAEQGSYFGYKGYGGAVIDTKGNKDRNEFYNVSKDDILSISPRLSAPDLFDKHRPVLSSYITTSHSLVSFILDLLSPRLALPKDKLGSLHRLNTVSGDQVRFVKAPTQPPEDRRTALGAHTDFGSVTVLFNRVGGLQVRLPDCVEAVPSQVPGGMSEAEKELTSDGWTYVYPLPGHAIINLGDALVKFTAGILRSNTHRVVAPPGDQGDVTRYSLVYFARPEDDVVLKALGESEMIEARVGKAEEGEKALTSKEWILKRALGRRNAGKNGVDFEGTKGTEDVRGARG